ncbi:MAG TPA: GNAT family N-acetyltransferase [Lachnospiraceae bacterium]|nr:GNAT family N-acetyltransferase [Lachnospiraceae bacterium]
MNTIEIKETIFPKAEEIVVLYNDVGWYAYTADLASLQKGLENSTYILSAWDGEKLVGILRAVGDEETIMYIQDILVLEEYQRRGIGSRLVEYFLQKYQNVRQKVLITDNTEKNKFFYKKCGFLAAEKVQLCTFVRMSL